MSPLSLTKTEVGSQQRMFPVAVQPQISKLPKVNLLQISQLPKVILLPIQLILQFSLLRLN
jgi:hypothetical protein